MGDYVDREYPVLLIANHISWWDGFWAVCFNYMKLKRIFYFMMLEEQLKKHWFFKYCGGFSVSRNSRSILESINYSVSLMADRRNLVLIFPQGEIQSIYKPEFQFEKGLEYILNKTENKIQIIFLANMPDYLAKAKPTLFMHVTEYRSAKKDIESLQIGYNKFYNKCLEKHKLLKS